MDNKACLILVLRLIQNLDDNLKIENFLVSFASIFYKYSNVYSNLELILEILITLQC